MTELTLFVSPKRGGILQSSGFLDLKSLMALNRTCKAHAIDELSFMLLIENEITRNHGVKTVEEAIDFWRLVCHKYPLLKQWLGRDGSNCVESITVTRYMLSDASPYEVMLVKMLRSLPTQSERLQLVGEQGRFGRTPLHNAAIPGNCNSLKTILFVYPESERLKAVSRVDDYGWTVLHCAVSSGNPESIRLTLSVYPESERYHLVNETGRFGSTILQCAASSGNVESMKLILALLPEWLSQQSESGRSSEKRSHDSALQDEEVDVEPLPEAKRQRSQ